MANDRINFYYDPAREGYDTTLWKTITGIPSVAGSVLRLSAATIIGYADLFKAETTYEISVPTIPQAYLTGGVGATAVVVTWKAVTDGSFHLTIDGVAKDITGLDFSGAGVTTMAHVAAIIQAGIRAATSDTTTTVVWLTDHFVITAMTAITVLSATGGGTDISGAGAPDFMDANVGDGNVTAAGDREFGFNQIGDAAKITFKINGGVLTCECLYDGVSNSTVVPWETAWTGASTEFTIKWTGFSAEFLINDIRRAFMTDLSVPKVALSQYVKNAIADNMDIAIIEVNNVQGYI